MNASPLPEIMTMADVAQLLDVHPSTIHRMRERGEIIGYKFGKRVYFRRSEIMASITANPIEVQSLQVEAEEVQQAA